MKLITHNILMCNKKGCTQNNFPLRLIAHKVEVYNDEAAMEYTPHLITRLLEKIDYAALYQTVQALQWNDVQQLPAPLEGGLASPDWAKDEAFLQNLYEICCRRHILEGAMQCPNCSREYAIKNGIANMLLNEDEV